MCGRARRRAIWLLGPCGHNGSVDTIYGTLPPRYTQNSTHHLLHIFSYYYAQELTKNKDKVL